MGIKKSNQDYNFFIYFSLFWITISWGLFLLTLLGIFYWWTTAILIALIAAGSARFILSSLLKVSRSFLVINIFSIFITVVFITFSTPTIFSGRDQGAISQAAIRLAQNGKLEFSTSTTQDFFNINSTQKDKLKNCLIDNLDDFQNNNSLKSKFYHIYCQAKTSSKAFNFPGFYYTANGNLVTQFPIVYIAWLALFYSFLGVLGFQIANGILLFSFLIGFYLLINHFSNSYKYSFKIKLFTQLLSLIIIATSFCFMWFSKFTLTENMATPLLWSGILALVILTKSKLKNLKEKKSTLLLFFMSLGLLVFTRIEGIIFLILAVICLISHQNSRKYFKDNFTKLILPMIILIGIIFIWNLNVDIYFYKSIAKATLNNLNENSTDVVKNNSLLNIFNLFKIFGLYGLLTPILFGLAGIFYLAKNKFYHHLIPLAIIFPSFIYILSPQITLEHPWMLRRFAPSILPIFILYSILLINRLYAKKNIILGTLIALLIICINLPAFSRYLTFIPNQGLLNETKNISQNFSNNDLILVDQLSSGDNFEMIADPLNSIFKKNAVYFFNPNDLEKIDKNKYEKIYLITPESKVDYYKMTNLKNNLKFFKNYSLPVTGLNLRDTYSFPQTDNRTVNGSIFEIVK